VFNEPVEQFFDILTGGVPEGQKRPGGKGAKAARAAQARTAEIPQRKTANNPFSIETEGEELDRLKIAIKKVDEMIKQERVKMVEREETLRTLKENEEQTSKAK
jgi:YEATS domain-containing protein 4